MRWGWALKEHGSRCGLIEMHYKEGGWGSYKQIIMSQPNPRAQVPGYCGYIPGKNSENKFGSTFGHITKDAYHTQPDAFLTTNIHNNSFIQQQHAADDRFWGNQGKVTAFSPPTQHPTKHNQRVDAPAFKPTPVTTLTYEEAIRKNAK